MLQFAREVAAAAQPPAVPAISTEAQWDSTGSGLEGLFLRRQGSPASEERVKDMEKPPQLAPPKLLSKLRLPLATALSSSSQPSAQPLEKRPSPRSLRISCEQRRQQERNRRTTATVVAQRVAAIEARTADKNIVNSKGEPLHFMLTESPRSEAMEEANQGGTLVENGGSQFEHFLLTDRLKEDEPQASASSVPLVTPRVGSGPVFYHLTPSAQEAELEPLRSSRSRSSRSSMTAGSTPQDSMADETPTRRENLSMEGLQASPESSPKSANQEGDRLSPTTAAESRQQRVLLRQARLRDGAEDRDYKRKKSRAANRELEESQQG
jgi:hypothetical protein